MLANLGLLTPNLHCFYGAHGRYIDRVNAVGPDAVEDSRLLLLLVVHIYAVVVVVFSLLLLSLWVIPFPTIYFFSVMTVQLSHAIDLFLHKDRASFFDDDTIAAGSIAPLHSRPAPAAPCFHWDLHTTCMPMLPAFQYISRKLAKRGLSVHLIISDHDPYVIAVWPLPKTSQLMLGKTVRKACSKFELSPSFLTALASHYTKKDLPTIFNAYRPDSYIVRKSILQNDVIFNGEGLTLLSIHHIYTFKQLLRTLSKRDWLPRARDVCLSSCVHLLHRINQIYTNPKVSKGYMARVYKEIQFQCSAYEEVYSAYNVTFCTASIKDVTILEPDYSALADISLNWDSDPSPTAAELPDTSLQPAHPYHSSQEDLISPIAALDLSTLQTWEAPSSTHLERISPLTYTYPSIPKPSPPPLPNNRSNRFDLLSPLSTTPHDPERWATAVSRPRSPKATWKSDSESALSPIDDVKTGEWDSDEDTKEQWEFNAHEEDLEDEVEAAEWIDEFPVPPQTREIRSEGERQVEQSPQQEAGEQGNWKYKEAEAWNPDEEATRDIVESWVCDIPAPLKTIESQGSEEMVQASPLEYVKAWVESWSSEPPATGVICARFHDKYAMERRVTIA